MNNKTRTAFLIAAIVIWFVCALFVAANKARGQVDKEFECGFPDEVRIVWQESPLYSDHQVIGMRLMLALQRYLLGKTPKPYDTGLLVEMKDGTGLFLRGRDGMLCESTTIPRENMRELGGYLLGAAARLQQTKLKPSRRLKHATRQPRK